MHLNISNKRWLWVLKKPCSSGRGFMYFNLVSLVQGVNVGPNNQLQGGF